VLISSKVVAVPPEASAIGEEMERFTPDGTVPTQTGVRVTEELKPLIELSIIGTDTSWPLLSVTGDVETMEKSGVAVVEVEVNDVVLVLVV
jgi:hypothetical protein